VYDGPNLPELTFKLPGWYEMSRSNLSCALLLMQALSAIIRKRGNPCIGVPRLVLLIEGLLRVQIGVLLINSKIEISSQRLRLAHGPAQRDIRKASFRVAATDIAMYPLK